MAGVRWRRSRSSRTATIAPLAGVETLGDFIINENVYGENGVLAGAIVVALMALALELLLALLQRRMTSKGLKLEPRLRCPNQSTERNHSMRTKTTRLSARAWRCCWRSS